MKPSPLPGLQQMCEFLCTMRFCQASSREAPAKLTGFAAAEEASDQTNTLDRAWGPPLASVRGRHLASPLLTKPKQRHEWPPQTRLRRNVFPVTEQLLWLVRRNRVFADHRRIEHPGEQLQWKHRSTNPMQRWVLHAQSADTKEHQGQGRSRVVHVHEGGPSTPWLVSYLHVTQYTSEKISFT